MKKSKLLLCVLSLSVAAAVAVSIRAQKQSGANAPKDAAAHPDCPSMSDGRQHPDCPLKGGDKTPGGDESSNAGQAGGHDAHLAAVNTRGEKAMGFSQTETTHHFILNADGGVIQVEAGDPNDAQNRAAIRQHLARVALMFATGDFDTPLLVHGSVPPGVPVMRRLKSEISYVYEETERGGRVRITTKNAEALAAVRDFLRFQITEHQTGDPLEVK
ncbi:MAG: hypothetical protein M3444_02020 [Acidobacteriota bacterium]|nr:hypothetical protein [Acidobacteriota bacterium]